MDPALLVVVVALLAVLSLAWSFSRANEIRARWAAQHGFEILSATYCWFWRGPFWWRSTDGQFVFRIVVRDRDGRQRSGWLRCGSWFLGLLSREATVVWEDE